MGLPDTYKLPENYYDAYRISGEGVAVPVVRYLAKMLLEPILESETCSVPTIVGTALRRLIEGLQSTKPMLVLLQVNGSVSDGWTGSPFWWPILVAPSDVEPCVFASKTED